MLRPFEVEFDYLRDHLEEMVKVTFSDLQSQFLVLPKGGSFIEYSDFQNAYEILKRHTAAFSNFNDVTIWAALREDSLSFTVLRTILGMTPPEWADLARSELSIDVPQNFSRNLDSRCRIERDYLAHLALPRYATTLDRINALISIAVHYIERGAPPGADDVVHRLAKADTAQGWNPSDILQHSMSRMLCCSTSVTSVVPLLVIVILCLN